MLIRLTAAALFILLVAAAPAAAAPAWLPPFPLVAEGPAEPAVAVAVAPDGTTVAAWSRANEGTQVVEAARRLPGGTFGAALPLGPGSAPQVAMDAAGNATVVWEATTTTPIGVAAARLPAAGTAFEATQTLSTTGVPARAPAIGVGPTGTAVALFTEGPLAGPVVLRAAIREGAGGDFAGAQTVSEATAGVNPAGATAAGEVAVAADGAAVALWSLENELGRYEVQTNVRPAGEPFPSTGAQRSPDAAAAYEPALAMDPQGRAVAAWTEDPDAVPGGPTAVKALAAPFTGTPETASSAGATAARPDLGALPDGTVVGAWVAGADGARRVETATAAAGSATFAGHAFLTSEAAGNTYPLVATGAGGDAMVAWQGFENGGIHAARRPTGGAFGGVDDLADASTAPAGTDLSLTAPAAGVDDQGNATVLWVADHVRAAAHHYRVEGRGFDAAAPALTSVSVPATATAGAVLPMSAAATDRWGPVTLSWAFGDGGTAAGTGVEHAFGAAGAFDVTVTATDAAGNASSTVRSLTVAAAPPAPPPPSPPPPPLSPPPPAITVVPAVDAVVALRWRVAGPAIKLERMRLSRMPAGATAELRCAGRRCPIRRTAIFAPVRGAIDIVKPLDVDQRRFRAGQRLDLRITAPGHIGQVLRFNLRRGRQPQPVLRCIPLGGTAVRRSC